jgi:hypothetical protein
MLAKHPTTELHLQSLKIILYNILSVPAFLSVTCHMRSGVKFSIHDARPADFGFSDSGFST